jgi:hypothetical protein
LDSLFSPQPTFTEEDVPDLSGKVSHPTHSLKPVVVTLHSTNQLLLVN